MFEQIIGHLLVIILFLAMGMWLEYRINKTLKIVERIKTDIKTLERQLGG